MTSDNFFGTPLLEREIPKLYLRRKEKLWENKIIHVNHGVLYMSITDFLFDLLLDNVSTFLILKKFHLVD